MDKNEIGSSMPPLPGHPEPFAMAWTELEMREIEEYGVACWNAGRTAAPTEIPAQTGTVDSQPAQPVAAKEEEILSLHRKMAGEKLRADQGWTRYEEANRDRNELRASLVVLGKSAPQQHAQAALSDEQIIEIATTTRSAEANKDGGYILPISFARAILSASQQPTTAPAEQAQDDAKPWESFGVEKTGDDHHDASNFLLNAAQEWWEASKRANVHGAVKWLTSEEGALLIYTRGEYCQQLLENIHKLDQKPVDFAKPSKQAEAQGKPSVDGQKAADMAVNTSCSPNLMVKPAVTVDTPEFVTVKDNLIKAGVDSTIGGSSFDMQVYLAAEDAFIEFIDAHTARAVAEALEGQQDALTEVTWQHDFLREQMVSQQPSQPAGAVQEPVAWGNLKVETGAVVPYRTHDQAKASVDNSYVGCPQEGPYKVVGLYTAPPAAAQSDVPQSLTASSACPVCGVDTPHRHSDLEICRWLETQASRFLPDGVKVISKSDYEQPALICQGQPQGHHGRYHVASQVNLWVPEGTKLYLHPTQQPDSERDAATPCPCCPQAIRNLAAVAHNICVRMPNIYDGELKRAVEQVKPLIDAHFADREHSHGEALAKHRGEKSAAMAAAAPQTKEG